MNKKGNSFLIIIILAIVILALIITLFIVFKNKDNNNKELSPFTWFIKTQLENGEKINADVVITYGNTEGLSEIYLEIKNDKTQKDIWLQVDMFQQCDIGNYLCAWVGSEVSYVKKYCFPINGTIIKDNKEIGVCVYPTENIGGKIFNQTHSVIDNPQIGKVEISSLNLKEETFILTVSNGSWRKPIICLDWNIGIISAGIKDKEEMLQEKKDYFKIKNYRCYDYDNSITDGNPLIFQVNYEKLASLESYVNITLMDRDRDLNNLRDGLYNDVYGLNMEDLGGKNYLFVLKEV